jgi:hypothetical protein
MHAKVREIYFRYRTTALYNNKTPADMYLQRNIRIQLEVIRPVKHVQNTERAVKSRQLSLEERVHTLRYIKNRAEKSWIQLSKNSGNSTTK